MATGADMTISTYSLDDPNPNRRYQHLSSWASPGVQMTLAYQQESKLLYSGATNGNIYSWKINERNLMSTLHGHSDIVMSLCNLPRLNNVASASLDKTICIWDSYTNERVLRLHGHKKGIFDLTYSSEYRLLVSCGFEHEAFVWSPFVHTMMGRLKGHHASLVGCVAVEGTPELITGDTSGVFKLWDLRNYNCVQTFSTNLSYTGHKDDISSKMACFIHTTFPSRNHTQIETDSRIYAASKRLSAFDQDRVVHEVTSDKLNIFWMDWNVEKLVIFTASERNITMWDALMGSKITRCHNICNDEISACCLDDRKRKIIIGDIQGNIGIYNPSNGSLIKRVDNSNCGDVSPLGAVVGIAFIGKSKRIIAGYSNGVIRVYNENTSEDCIPLQTFDRGAEIHDELHILCYNIIDKTVGTMAPAKNFAKLWNYESGRSEIELTCCGEKEYVVELFFLKPYPYLLTSDSSGNVQMWGSRGSRWPGMRISGFLNQTIVDSEFEEMRKYRSDEDIRPEIIHALAVAEAALADESTVEIIDESILSTFNNTTAYLKKCKTLDDSKSDLALSTMREVAALSDICESKWGPVAPVQTMAWHEPEKLVFVADDAGMLRCFDFKDVFDDIQEAADSKLSGNIRGICQRKARTAKSALPPKHTSYLRYLVAKQDNAMSYMGVNFMWTLVAHSNRITKCYCAPYGVLTAAADRIVKMWSFRGEPIGSLLQSVPEGLRSKSWDLPLDAEAIMAKEYDELDVILQKVTNVSKDPNRPDAETADFTGLAPGPLAADFNRSELRRRVDKSNHILGLSFPSADHGRISHSQTASSLGDLNDAMSLDSSVSSSSKTVDSAMQELKSVHAAVDYDAKRNALTYRQRRLRANKINSIAEKYHRKGGVKVLSTVNEVIPRDTELDEANLSVFSVDETQESDVNSFMSPKVSPTKITSRHSGFDYSKTALLQKACSKYSTFAELERALSDTAAFKRSSLELMKQKLVKGVDTSIRLHPSNVDESENASESEIKTARVSTASPTEHGSVSSQFSYDANMN